MDLSFGNNQTFTMTFNVAQWKPIFPLTACVFHMQVRAAQLASQGILTFPVPVITLPVPVIYAWSSSPADLWGNGIITYTDATGLLFFTAPYTDMLALLPGNYEWDLALRDPGGFVKILTGGAFVVTAGVTLH